MESAFVDLDAQTEARVGEDSGVFRAGTPLHCSGVHQRLLTKYDLVQKNAPVQNVRKQSIHNIVFTPDGTKAKTSHRFA